VEGYKREEEYSLERSEMNMIQEIWKKRVHKNRNGSGRIHELSVKRTILKFMGQYRACPWIPVSPFYFPLLDLSCLPV
jgi:hypothetical protein